MLRCAAPVAVAVLAALCCGLLAVTTRASAADPQISTTENGVVIAGDFVRFTDDEGTVDLRTLYGTVSGLVSQVDSLQEANDDLSDRVSQLEDLDLQGQINAADEDISALQSFQEMATPLLPPGPPTQTINLNPGEERDIGDILNEVYAAGTIDVYLNLYPSGDPENPAVYHWDTTVTVPTGSTINIYGVGSQHRSVRYSDEDGRVDDLTRCPTVIFMDEANVMDRPGSGYDGYVTYYRLILQPHARAQIQGVTLREDIHDHLINDAVPIYEHGIVTVRGPFSSLIIRDSRVEFGQRTFVNSHSAGRTFVSFGHVRFVGVDVDVDGGDEIYPLTSSRGQSWSGNVCEAAVTGGAVESGVVYHPEVLTGQFQLHYLAL